MHTALMVAIALAAAAPAKKSGASSATQKDAIKGAIAVDSQSSGGEASADGGTAEAAPVQHEGPDVSKMSFGDGARAVIAYWQPKIQQCYEETLAGKDKDVQGVVKAKWVVNPDGIVKKAEVVKKGTTLKDPKLHDCVVTVLSSMTFPKTPNGKDQPMDIPFNLKPVH